MTPEEKMATAIVKAQTAQKHKDDFKKALGDFIGNLLGLLILLPVAVLTITWLIGALLGAW